MGTEAGGDAGGSNFRSRSGEGKSSEDYQSVVNLYREVTNACALHAEAERVQMMLSYVDLEKQLGPVDIQDSPLVRVLIQPSKRGGLNEPEQICSYGSPVACY